MPSLMVAYLPMYNVPVFFPNVKSFITVATSWSMEQI